MEPVCGEHPAVAVSEEPRLGATATGARKLLPGGGDVDHPLVCNGEPPEVRGDNLGSRVRDVVIRTVGSGCCVETTAGGGADDVRDPAEGSTVVVAPKPLLGEGVCGFSSFSVPLRTSCDDCGPRRRTSIPTRAPLRHTASPSLRSPSRLCRAGCLSAPVRYGEIRRTSALPLSATFGRAETEAETEPAPLDSLACLSGGWVDDGEVVPLLVPPQATLAGLVCGDPNFDGADIRCRSGNGTLAQGVLAVLFGMTCETLGTGALPTPEAAEPTVGESVEAPQGVSVCADVESASRNSQMGSKVCPSCDATTSPVGDRFTYALVVSPKRYIPWLPPPMRTTGFS